MKLNRDLQRSVLEALREVYPEEIDDPEDLPGFDLPEFVGNVYYLHEHELIDMQDINALGVSMRVGSCAITATGLDFLEDDGGVSAILNTVTVKFDQADLTRILESGIASSDLPEKEKSNLVKTLRKLPSDAIKSLSMRLLHEGVDRLPDALQLIRKYLDPLS